MLQYVCARFTVIRVFVRVQLFHTDDYELAVLQEGRCPFCRRESPYAKKPTDEEHDEEPDES